MDTGGRGDDEESAARGGRWSGNDVTTGTSPTTDTQPTAPRKAGGGRRSGTPTATATGRPTRRLVIVESPTKAKKIAPVPRQRLRRRVLGRAHPRPAARRRRRPGQVQGRVVGAARAWTSTTSSQPLYIVTPEKKGKVAELRDALKSVDELLLATDHDREGEAIAWHLLETLKPKVPVRRMVFHEITEPAIRAAAAEPARPRPGPGRRPGDPAHPRPPLRLRGLPRAVEEGHAEALGGPGAVGGHPDHRAARARADGVRRRPAYWDIAAQLDAGADATPRTFGARLVAVDGDRVATGRDFGPDGQLQGAGDSAARVLDEAQRPPPGRGAAGPRPGRRVGRVEALHAQAVRAVHDLDAAAGGRPQAALLRRPHDAQRAAAVRERLHHLHAHRLHDAVRVGDQGGPRAGPRAVRRRVRLAAARGSTPARSRTPRRRTRRSGRPGRPSAPRARWPARSTATTSGSTS